MKKSTLLRTPSVSASMIETLETRELFSTFVVTNTADTGTGSLRWAIQQANRTTELDVVQFKIGAGGAKTIAPLTSLPYITNPITIDGSTQPGYAGKPIIEIRGDKFAGGTGLSVGGGYSTIKGLVINRFGNLGIMVVKQGNNTIKNCYIGTDITGSYAAPNAQKGILLQTANNTVGGTTAADRNVISGNGTLGIQFWTPSATLCKIQGNYIGTDATGNKAIPNGTSGIGINGGYKNLIGGSVFGAGNVISGNKEDGIVINGAGASDNAIQGNIIGLNAAGTTRLGNLHYGIETSQPRTKIGGTLAAERNVVSGNSYSGVVLWLSSSSNNTVIGNYIGTDITGKKDIGNYWRGVDVSNGSANNIIGGYTAAERNVISGNDACGVMVYQGTNNKFINNYVGFGSDGYTSVGNFGDGFRLVKTDGVSIINNKIGNNTGYAVHNGTSTNTLVKGNTLVNDVLFLVTAV